MSDLVNVGALWSVEEIEVSNVPFEAEDIIYTGKLGEANCAVVKNTSKDNDKYPDYYLYAINERSEVTFAIRVGALWKYTGNSEHVAANGKFGRSNLIVMINKRKEKETHPDMQLYVGRPMYNKEESNSSSDKGSF